jgi:hypothetical protein
LGIGRRPVGGAIAAGNGGVKYDQYIFYMYENVIMKPIKVYNK